MPPVPISTPEPGGGGKVLPENLQLKLIVTEKEQQIGEISCVVATTQFSTNAADPLIGFSGTIVPEEGGTFLVRYVLSQLFVTENRGSSNTTSTASVRLQLGEPIQILKLGNYTYQLTVSRLAEAPKKGK